MFQKYRTNLLLGWCLLVKVILLSSYGVVIANDSTRYITYASNLTQWVWRGYDFDAHYIAYSAIIALCQLIGCGLNGVVAIQILASLLALHCLWILSCRWFHDKLVADMTLLMVGSWWFGQQWDCYILTESLFASAHVFMAYFLCCSKRPWRFFAILGLAVFAFLLRPQGFVLSLAGLIYLVFERIGQINRPFFIMGAVAMVIVLWFANASLRPYFGTLLYDNLASGQIISGYQDLALPTSGLVLPDRFGEPVPELLLFVGRNPLYATSLFLAKVVLFFAHIRPYYSWFHNACIMVVLWPMYLLACWGLWREKRIAKAERYFVIFLVTVHAAVVGAYMEDWDGRFLVPVLPFIFLMGVPELVKLLSLVLVTVAGYIDSER